MNSIAKKDAIRRLQDLIDRISALKIAGARSADLTKWKRDAKVVISHLFGDKSDNIGDFTGVRYTLSVTSPATTEDDRDKAFLNGLSNAQAVLESMIKEIQDFWRDKNHELSKEPITAVKTDRAIGKNREVFVVHGHDEEMKQAVARVLKTIGLDALILHEKPDKSRTIIEKFTDYSDVSFAVVLLSPEDICYCKSDLPDQAKPRARQNVIFELGFFVGKLGRDRVLALLKKGENFDFPSDIHGVLYKAFDESGTWRFELVKELKAAGYSVDANKLLE